MPTHPLILCLDLMHNMQKESGLALLLLHGKDADQEGPLPREIRNQFTLTDAARVRLQTLAPEARARLATLFDALEDLPARRIDVMSRFARPSGIQSWYSAAFLAPLRAFATERLLHDAQIPPLQVGAFLHLLDWCAEVARVRDSVADCAGTAGWLERMDIRTRLKAPIQNQMAYERLFFALADDMQKQTLATIKAAGPTNSGFADELCAAILTDRALPLLKNMAALDWFSALTAKTDQLIQLAKTLAARLLSDRDEDAGFVEMPLDTDVESHLDMIRTLPLFKGLERLTLASLLRTARIVHVDKGDMLVSQGMTAASFFIVLDGWIKVYKSNADGEEAVLQILGKKEPLLDTGFLQAAPCPVNARAVSKAKLLSIPVGTLREHLARTKELVTNILAAVTTRLWRLIAHFEQVTLRGAAERVGWFLLTLYREAGLEDRPLALPYDKSLIAAFLNIKPETFSRVLQNFKNNGFLIEKHQITMPSPRALCAFCDSDIAFRCCNAESEECPRTELRRGVPARTAKKNHV